MRAARELAEQEQDPVAWFAFRQDATTVGVFDTFDDEQGRQGHLQCPIAAALGEIAQIMLSPAPVITLGPFTRSGMRPRIARGPPLITISVPS